MQNIIAKNSASKRLQISNRLLCAISLILFLHSSFKVYSQEISFKRISVSNGLSDNLVYAATLDQNGILWVGTEGGLDSYNGHNIKHWDFFDEAGTNVLDIYCDRNNELWILDGNNKLWKLDKNRKFNKVLFGDSTNNGRVRYLLPLSNDSIYCWIANDIYKLNKEKCLLQKIGSLPDSLAKFHYQSESKISGDRYAIPSSNHLIILNLAACKIEKVFQIKNTISAQVLQDGNLLVSTAFNRKLYKVDWNSGMILKNYGELKDQYGRQIKGYFRNSCMLPDGRIVFTSGFDGAIMFDQKKETITNYRHDPVNDRSVSGNNTYRIFSDSSGNVFITTRSSGLNYFNINQTDARYFRIIKDSRTGKLFDGFIQSFAEDSSGNIWISGQGGLMRYNKATGQFNFIDYGSVNGEILAGNEEVRCVYVDDSNRIWIGLNRFGVVVLDPQLKPLKYFRTELDQDQKLSGNFITNISKVTNGEMLISSTRGLDLIDPNSLRVIPIESFKELKKLSGRSCYANSFNGSDTIWIGVSNGVYRYIYSDRLLDFFGKDQGLSGQYISSILPDGNGNIYLGGRKGLEILRPDGNVKFFDSKNGLPYNDALRLLPGENNRVWVANDYALVLMDAEAGVIKVADQRNGIPATGFRIGSGFKASDGLLYFGTNEGFLEVDPERIFQSNPLPRLMFSALYTSDSSYRFTGDTHIELPFSSNSFGVQIDAIALFYGAALPVEYMLEGYDTQWKKTEANEPIQYQNIPVGSYKFKLRFAQADLTAITPINSLTVEIIVPWWRSWWFIGIIVLFLSALISWIGNIFLEKRKAKQEALEIERVVYEFANSMHEKHTLNEIINSLTQNTIAKLGFEDCIVYLWNEKTKMLEQVAAWGGKAQNGVEIVDPIALSLGEGIVGSVALSGAAEIVPDTSKDPRYIKDDKQRYSEIAVPIFSDEKVIGIIDSEHSQKHFFTDKHLSLLTTLASILGSRITSIAAEERKRMAEMALMANERKTAEIEMQALRAQMNPHFLFNSLNSINNFILKNDADNASSYLTRFSRLMRMILDNSRQDWITLDSEIKALRLYVDMESIRFDYAFDFQIAIQDGIDLDFIMVPPLIIQPYVENAIWHGLLHRKEPGGLLKITISAVDELLKVVIEDNGVGRQEAARLKSKLGESRKSHGLQITRERIRIVNEVYGVAANVEIDDLVDSLGNIMGTSVTLSMKLKQTMQTMSL